MDPDERERLNRVVDHEVKGHFPPGAVRRAVLLRHGDEPGIEPGQLRLRVFVAADAAADAADEQSLAAWRDTHQAGVDELRRDLSRRLPSARVLELTFDGTGPDATVLAATMDNDFSAFPNATFPVYTLRRDRGRERGDLRRHDRGRESACQGLCAVYWPPLLTSDRPVAGPGVDQHALGFILRPDGTHQVTYHGQPLYLFNKDAYIGPPVDVGTQGIYGAGARTPWGVFNTIPPLH